MRELLNFILQSITFHPEDVEIVQVPSEEENQVAFTILLHPEDMGKVIGKEGKVIHSIRNLLKVIAIQERKRVYLDVKEKEPAPSPSTRLRTHSVEET